MSHSSVENKVETPSKTSPIESPEKTETPPCISPSPVKSAEPMEVDENDHAACKDFPKLLTPERLRVPKPFKYPERYTSPTDMMVSPVTRGILARSRKSASLIPPSRNHLKIPELRIQEEALSRNS